MSAVKPLRPACTFGFSGTAWRKVNLPLASMLPRSCQ